MKGGFFPDIDKPSEPIAGNLHTYNFCEDLDISHSQIHSLRESSPYTAHHPFRPTIVHGESRFP